MQTKSAVVNVLHLDGPVEPNAAKISAAGALNHHCAG
jgi:hypothetical protein